MSASGIVVHGIANCDTVKKARAWLTAEGLAYDFHDFKRDGLSAALLDAWIAAVGVQTLVNRKERPGAAWTTRCAPRSTTLAPRGDARAAQPRQAAGGPMAGRLVQRRPGRAARGGGAARGGLRRIAKPCGRSARPRPEATVSRRAAAAARMAGCRRAGSSRPRSACRCAHDRISRRVASGDVTTSVASLCGLQRIERDVDGLVAAQAQTLPAVAAPELQRQHAHTDQVGTVDALEAARDDGTDAEQLGALGRPVAARSGAVPSPAKTTVGTPAARYFIAASLIDMRSGLALRPGRPRRVGTA